MLCLDAREIRMVQKAAQVLVRALSAVKQNYDTTTGEYVAVVWEVQLLHPYLKHGMFSIHRDHDALKGLVDTAEETGKLARGSLSLSQFESSVMHTAGI